MLPTVKENDDIAKTPLVKSVSSVPELIDVLTARIDYNDQFFLVIRRGATLKRQLTIWDRQSKKKVSHHEVNGSFCRGGGD